MFKVGDIVAWSTQNEWFKVVKIHALGFDVVRVSGFVGRYRVFYKNAKTVYKQLYSNHSYKLLTKQHIQNEIDNLIEPYIKFMETMP